MAKQPWVYPGMALQDSVQVCCSSTVKPQPQDLRSVPRELVVDAHAQPRPPTYLATYKLLPCSKCECFLASRRLPGKQPWQTLCILPFDAGPLES